MKNYLGGIKIKKKTIRIKNKKPTIKVGIENS